MYRDNFKQYYREHLVHVGVGAFAGFLVMIGRPVAGLIIMFTVYVRQALEFAKRRDTPGVDLSYHLGGLLLGILFVVWILVGGRRK